MGSQDHQVNLEIQEQRWSIGNYQIFKACLRAFNISDQTALLVLFP